MVTIDKQQNASEPEEILTGQEMKQDEPVGANEESDKCENEPAVTDTKDTPAVSGILHKADILKVTAKPRKDRDAA